MGIRVIGVAALSAVLAGCQATNFYYERMGDGPPVEYAQAQCEIGAMGTEQGYFVYGTQAQVMGAQLGNAIANEQRKQIYMRNCMVMQGWRQVPITKTSEAYKRGSQSGQARR